MSEPIAELKRKRGVIKAFFTRAQTSLDKTQKFDTPQKLAELRARFTEFDTRYADFEELDLQIAELDPGSSEIESFEEDYFALVGRIESLLATEGPRPSSSQSSGGGAGNSSAVRLSEQIERFLAFFESGFNDNIIELQCRVTQLESLWAQFELTKLNSVDDYTTLSDQYFRVLSLAKRHIADNSREIPAVFPQNNPEISVTAAPQGMKLPPIRLPEFDGCYSNWLRFRDLFQSLVHSTTLPKAQKFQYLKTSLIKDAEHVLDSLEITDENYDVAWKLVNERFENKRLIVHNHVKALFELPTLPRENYTALRELIDSVNKHLRALKTLGQVTENWDALIVYMVSSRLDNQTRREWELANTTNEPSTFDSIMSFLNNRCNHLEAIYSNKVQEQSKAVSVKFNTNQSKRSFGKSQCNIGTTNSCGHCKGPHLIYKCSTFRQLTPAARGAAAREKQLCGNCLMSGHKTENCKSSNCRVCDQQHNTLLHVDSERAPKIATTPTTQTSTTATATLTSHIIQTNVLLSTAVVKVFDKNGKVHELRVLLDSGSQSNFITLEACKLLDVQMHPSCVSITGINSRSVAINQQADIKFHSRTTSFSETASCLVLPKITENMPSVYLTNLQFKIPAFIQLADPNFDKPGKIDILLGSGLFWDLLTADEQIRLGKHQPTLQCTVLGWIVSGPVSSSPTQSLSCNLSTLEQQVKRFWEVEEISNCDIRSEEERACEQHYLDNYSRDSEGRFIVKLPFKETTEPLGNSKNVAEKRFKLLEKRLRNDDNLHKEYSGFMSEYLELNHMELSASVDNHSDEYFLPHHAVVKDSTTTKVRVVFDGSARTSTGVSLNDQLMVGPTIQQDLFLIINRFRIHKYVLTGDIAKMYRQILIDESHRKFQKIFWRPEPTDTVKIFQLSTVTYGTASAPYLAIKTLFQLAAEEEQNFPRARKIIERDFYVDDLITGSDFIDELVEIREQVTNCLKRGGLELRKWATNDERIISTIPTDDSLVNLDKQVMTKTLGLNWNFKTDMLTYSVSAIEQRQPPTKRSVLSVIARLFDPLGLLGPIIIMAKVMMQKLWSLKAEWDEELPIELQTQWQYFIADLSNLTKLKIPRQVTIKLDYATLELHGFSDASEYAYGACVYIRTTDVHGMHTTNLLCAKSRVSPLKALSIPRLELCGAVLLTRLIEKVTIALDRPVDAVFLWTDSTIVLSWLSATPKTWKTFVANRVSEILQTTNRQNWNHVSSENNPADVISRGCSTSSLIEFELWWHGPNFLKLDNDKWPEQKLTIQTDTTEELRLVSLVSVEDGNPLVEHFKRFSSFTRLIRVIAFCLRFGTKLTNRNHGKTNYLTVNELERSRLIVLKITQQSTFFDEFKQLKTGESVNKKSKLLSLTPFIDEEGLLRVGGRLSNTSLNFDKKHQIILPNHNHVTDLLIRHDHERSLHAGNLATLAAVRERYWPVSGRNEVKKIIRKCINCFKINPSINTELMGNLPPKRVEIARPFFNTGIDYAGPFLIKEGKGRGKRQVKAYISVFICFSTKAIHLELVGDLTTESFLGALNRFVSRRGNVGNIFSDNGSNFVGAFNELNKVLKSLEFQSKVVDQLANNCINWHFIPPRTPHFGGLWEASVRSVKLHLKKILNNASVTFEELYTLLVRVEACLNSRPLTPISPDPSDLTALTPGHFLIGGPLTSVMEPNYIDYPSNRLSRWQYIEQLRQQFWDRWSREYVPLLQKRTKWNTQSQDLCQIGAMVLIKEDHLPPQRWALGRIVATHPGPDGLIRVLSIKTSGGVIKRSITKVCVLPVD